MMQQEVKTTEDTKCYKNPGKSAHPSSCYSNSCLDVFPGLHCEGQVQRSLFMISGKRGWKSKRVLSSLSNPFCISSVFVSNSMKLETEIKPEASQHSLEVRNYISHLKKLQDSEQWRGASVLKLVNTIGSQSLTHLLTKPNCLWGNQKSQVSTLFIFTSSS